MTDNIYIFKQICWRYIFFGKRKKKENSILLFSRISGKNICRISGQISIQCNPTLGVYIYQERFIERGKKGKTLMKCTFSVLHEICWDFRLIQYKKIIINFFYFPGRKRSDVLGYPRLRRRLWAEGKTCDLSTTPNISRYRLMVHTV